MINKILKINESQSSSKYLKKRASGDVKNSKLFVSVRGGTAVPPMRLNPMLLNIKIKFFEKKPTNSIYNVAKYIDFNDISKNVQKKLLDLLANSAKYKKYLEHGISFFGSIFQDSAGNYLQLKINKIKPIIKKPTSGIFSKTVIELEIKSSIYKITKKIKGAQCCEKKLTKSELERFIEIEKALLWLKKKKLTQSEVKRCYELQNAFTGLIKSTQWCKKKLTELEVIQLFNEDKLLKQIDWLKDESHLLNNFLDRFMIK